MVPFLRTVDADAEMQVARRKRAWGGRRRVSGAGGNVAKGGCIGWEELQFFLLRHDGT